MPEPNIIFITCHDLGRHLGCYGAPVNSPNIDRLSREGIRFSNTFSTSPLCSPSRASLHTGLYPHRVGVNGLSHPPFGMEITEPETHLAHLLGRAGYEERILIGFQHLASDSERLGYTDARFRLGSAESIGAEAAQVIREKSGNNPFYLEVGFFETHRPFDWGGAEPKAPPSLENPFPYLRDGEEVRGEAAALAGAVGALDHGMGQILDALRDAGIEKDTWVIFATDHGLPFPRAKGTLYDPGLETALLMRWPGGGLSGGGEAAGLASLVDIVPTIAAVLALDPGRLLDGVDLSHCLKRGAGGNGPRKFIFAEKTFHTGYEPMRCVRTDDYKLIINFETGPAFDIPTDIITTPTAALVKEELPNLRPTVELYDLRADPLERTNLAGDPALAGVREQLTQLLGDWMRRTGDPLLNGPVSSPTHHRGRDELKPGSS